MQTERLDTARVFERIFSIYRAQAGVLLPGAFILILVPAALGLAPSRSMQALSLALSLIAIVAYQGFVVQATRDIQDGVRDLSLGRLLGSVSRVFGPLLWTAILVGVGVFLGLIAFIVPGLILITIWAVAVPVVVCEPRGPVEALARSRALVHGHGWRVFGVLIVTFIIVLVARLVALAIAGNSDIGLVVASLVAGTLTAPISALASAVLYLELLRLKGEALPPADMAGFNGER